MKNKLIKIALVLSAFMLTIACNDDDDLTGDSVANVASPSLSVALDFANDQTLVEDEVTYGFTVSLSQAQIVDVVIYLEMVSGTATEGDDFSFPHSMRIPAGSTSASDVIAIHADELIEDTETATIRIGTGAESNVSATNSETVSFSIMNLVEGDLSIGMDWSATGSTFGGDELGPYELADLRLLVSTGPNNTDLIGGADGGADEHWVMSSSTPDGDYYVVADWYAGYDEDFTVDVDLSFDQVGVINGQTHSFPAALTSTETCSASYTVLAKITKTGNSYAFEEIGSAAPLNPTLFEGTWEGTTSYGYPTQMVTTWDGSQLSVTGVGVGFMEQDWGEVIITMETLVMDVDWETGAFTVAEAPYMTTTYLGDATDPYSLSAVGTLSGTCTPTIHFDYDFVQAGTSYTDWLTVGNGWPPFEENNTL